MIQSVVSAASYQEMQRTEEHAELHHKSATTKVHMVGNGIDQMTWVLQKKLDKLQGSKRR